jgi:hypothetical protein
MREIGYRQRQETGTQQGSHDRSVVIFVSDRAPDALVDGTHAQPLVVVPASLFLSISLSNCKPLAL